MPLVVRGEPRLAHNVVMDLVQGLEGKGHVLVMDNFFSSIGLFTKLAAIHIYATGTIRCNRVGLPLELKTLKDWKNSPQGTLHWKMHKSRGISCVLWKDKRLVLLISTHALPIDFPCVPVPTVPRRDGALRKPIPTSPIHLEYTTHMRGVDVADKLRASYTCQSRSHKWSHRIFAFLLDTTVVNMYILYQGILRAHDHGKTPMTHLQFKANLCDALLQNWIGRGTDVEEEDPRRHLRTWTRIRSTCILCGFQSCHHYCRAHNRAYLCLNHGCFEEFYYRPRNHRGVERRRWTSI